MSIIEVLTAPDLATNIQAAAAVIPRAGIIDTANDQTNQLGDLVKNLGGLAVTVLLLAAAIKSKLGVGAIIGALFIGGIVLFALNGGMGWLADQVNGQLQAGISVDAPANTWTA